MLQTIRSVASLLLSYGLLLLANGMFGTLLGLRGKFEGFSTETVGFVMSGFFVGLLLGAVYAVRVVAQVGHIRAFAAFASIMSVAALAHVLYIDPFFWSFLRLTAGFCMAGMVMIVESWLNERSVNRTRGQILSLYMMTNYLGAGVGQFLLTVADPAEFRLFAVASIVFSIALVPILLTRASAPKPSSPQRMKFRDLFAVSPVGVIGTFCAGMANATLNSLGPIFALESGLSIAGVSTFMACVILGGMVLQFPIGRLSDRVDRRSVLIVAALATSLACLGIVWATTQPVVLLYAAGALYGGFCYTIYPLSSAQINDLADPDRLVQVAAGLLIAYGIGASAGPIIAAQVMGRVGPDGMFMFNAVVTGALALFTAYRMVSRRRGEKTKAAFLPLGGLGLSSKQLFNAALRTIVRSKRGRGGA